MKVVLKATSTPFLIKLWKMLNNINYHHAICWTGINEFAIIDIKALERDVLHLFFRSAQFSSFQRQLNYFSFTKLGKKRYTHPLFDRTCPHHILLIKRKTNTGNLLKNRKAAGQRRKAPLRDESHLTSPSHTSIKENVPQFDHTCPQISPPTLPRPALLATKSPRMNSRLYDHDPQLKPVTPMTPFMECLRAADKPPLLRNTSFSNFNTKEKTSFPLLSDLEAFERSLDWANNC